MTSARQMVFEGMELLPSALVPFIEARLSRCLTGQWQRQVMDRVHGLRARAGGDLAWNQAALLRSVILFWKDAFAPVLGPAVRAHASELIEWRNRLAHFEPLSWEDAERALDTMRRLADEIDAQETGARLEEIRRAARRRSERAYTICSGPDTVRDSGPTRLPHMTMRLPARGTKADAIRAFVVAGYAEPARKLGKRGFTVRAGDVHRAMGLSNEMPNVCSALGGRKFESAAGVRLKTREGPRAGATVTFTFVFAD